MKWGPQPKPRCGRPDCDRDARQWGYCPNHAALLDRNGTPYTQEEVVGMREANRHAQEMDAALAKNPPVIQWRKNSRGIFEAAYVHDPHGETGTKAQAGRERRAFEMEQREIEARIAVQQLEELRQELLEPIASAGDDTLMTAARTEI